MITERALIRVVYFNLPDAAWERNAGMHVLDFGLDLEFKDSIVHLTWAQKDQSLEIGSDTLRRHLVGAVEHDASESVAWRQMIGHGLTAKTMALLEQPSESETGCSISIAFEGGDSGVWIAAASYFVEEDLLLLCGDEIVVIWDPAIASRLGLQGTA